MKNIRVFLSENFKCLEVTISIYLNRRVFVMNGTKHYQYFRTLSVLEGIWRCTGRTRLYRPRMNGYTLIICRRRDRALASVFCLSSI